MDPRVGNALCHSRLFTVYSYITGAYHVLSRKNNHRLVEKKKRKNILFQKIKQAGALPILALMRSCAPDWLGPTWLTWTRHVPTGELTVPIIRQYSDATFMTHCSWAVELEGGNSCKKKVEFNSNPKEISEEEVIPLGHSQWKFHRDFMHIN